MSVKVVVGAQFGDEGKGKIVDYLAGEADMTVRFQGGDNAGHTVMNNYGTFKLHLVPCGIFHENCTCLIGTGTVVNPDVLIGEIEMLKQYGVSVKKLHISNKAQIVMPYHILLDQGMEKLGGIGTTKRGIGQTYASKFLRKNFRFEDLLKPETWQRKIKENMPFFNAQLRYFNFPDESENKLILKMQAWSDVLSPMICDGFSLLHSFIDEDKQILFEGQLGTMKDIDLGIYPYVTSSNPVAAYAAVSGGFPTSKIKEICGVAKAFTSAVGDGPFPTEMDETESILLQGCGDNPDDEYGARTGRKRRIGWIDIPMLKYANTINGFTEMALTKLDKMDALKTIKVCIGYMLDGSSINGMPDTDSLYRVAPVYKEFEGWQSSTAGCKSYSELPVNAKKYIEFIEQQVGVQIIYIGNGPKRNEIIRRAI